MNEQTAIIQADSWTTQVENYLAAHPVVKWLFLAWFFGWMAAFIVRLLIRNSPLVPDSAESRIVVLTSVFAAGGAAFRVWSAEYPGEYPIIVATIVAGLSIPAYLLLAWLLCKWKPDLEKHLSLRKDFAAAVDDEPPQPPAAP